MALRDLVGRGGVLVIQTISKNQEKTLWKHRNTPALYFLSLVGIVVFFNTVALFILKCHLADTFLPKLKFL